jgi:hypothetical protein
MLGSFTCLVYILVDGIRTYSNDLKDKSGYLVFMAPVSSYGIIGAKLLASFIKGTVLLVVLCICAIIDTRLILNAYGSNIDMIDTFLISFLNIHGGNIALSLVTLYLSIVFGVACVICLAYLSSTISATLLQNSRFRRLISIIIFIVLSIITSRIWNMVSPKIATVHEKAIAGGDIFMFITTSLAPVAIEDVVVAVICLVISGYLLDKKVSL